MHLSHFGITLFKNLTQQSNSVFQLAAVFSKAGLSLQVKRVNMM